MKAVYSKTPWEVFLEASPGFLLLYAESVLWPESKHNISELLKIVIIRI